MQKFNQSGFSLAELMVAAAIMAILATLAVSSYQNSVVKAKRSEAKSALYQLMQQEEIYYSQNNSYIVFSHASTDASEVKFKWFSGDTATRSSYEIKATACNGDTIQNCVLLTATPGTSFVDSHYTDPVCANYTLTSTGIKGLTGTGTKDTCW